jgi:hypothetical protein
MGRESAETGPYGCTTDYQTEVGNATAVVSIIYGAASEEALIPNAPLSSSTGFDAICGARICRCTCAFWFAG